jgi:hypothetical protein
MSDFRGPLPLDDRDFAELRRNVLSRIGRRRIAIPLTLAAAAVLAVIIILLPQPRITVPPPHTPPIVSMPPAAEPAPVKIARKEPVRKPSGAPPPDSEITMNIETADPNVRIIWIAR